MQFFLLTMETGYEAMSRYDRTPALSTQDLLGLQHLNSSGRLQFIPAPFNHLQFTPDWFVDNLMMYISATQSSVRAPVRMRMGGWKQGDRKPVFFAGESVRAREGVKLGIYSGTSLLWTPWSVLYREVSLFQG